METLLAACGEEATEDATDTVVNSSAVAAANSFGGAVTPLEGLLTPRRAVGGLAGLLLSRAEQQATSTPNMSSRSLFGGGEGLGGREEARPSPERLDAQIRSLTYSQVKKHSSD